MAINRWTGAERGEISPRQEQHRGHQDGYYEGTSYRGPIHIKEFYQVRDKAQGETCKYASFRNGF
jgi:hypothetical protein